MNRLNLSDFPGADDRARFAAALNAARENPGSTLVVPPGTYRITSDLARRTRDEVISGRYGDNPEKAMFSPAFRYDRGLDFFGHEGTVLEADGAVVMIDGFMEPVSLRNCRGVSIRGLTIDHVRKPFSFGEIEAYQVEDDAARTGHILVRFDDSCPVDENTIMPRSCAYDRRTGCFNLDMKIVSRQFLGGQRYRFDMRKMPQTDLTGQVFYIWHSFHSRPAILVQEAKDIALTDVTIHSQPGMGVVGHRSENVLMERLRVTPSKGLHLSTNTDATHFASCKGEITFRDCTFDGHGDDATNVHTYYHDIQPLSADTYRGSVAVPTHTAALDHPDVGDEMELVDKATLNVRRTYRVVAVECHEAEMNYIARLDAPLPADAAENCCLADVTRAPYLRFLNCTANNHWARSVLIKTRRALVEGCTFSNTALQAVHVAAESWWREGVACRDVTIRGNRFVNCGTLGHAPVSGVKVEMAVEQRSGTPQERITVEDNVFDLPEDSLAIHISNARDVSIRRNRFLRCGKAIEIVDCENVRTDC